MAVPFIRLLGDVMGPVAVYAFPDGREALAICKKRQGRQEAPKPYEHLDSDAQSVSELFLSKDTRNFAKRRQTFLVQFSSTVTGL